MNDFETALLIFGLVVDLLTIIWFLHERKRKRFSEKTKDKVWEYYWLAFDFKKADMDKIDKLGSKGWELIGIFDVNEGNLKFGAILKRRKKK